MEYKKKHLKSLNRNLKLSDFQLAIKRNFKLNLVAKNNFRYKQLEKQPKYETLFYSKKKKTTNMTVIIFAINK